MTELDRQVGQQERGVDVADVVGGEDERPFHVRRCSNLAPWPEPAAGPSGGRELSITMARARTGRVPAGNTPWSYSSPSLRSDPTFHRGRP